MTIYIDNSNTIGIYRYQAASDLGEGEAKHWCDQGRPLGEQKL